MHFHGSALRELAGWSRKTCDGWAKFYDMLSPRWRIVLASLPGARYFLGLSLNNSAGNRSLQPGPFPGFPGQPTPRLGRAFSRISNHGGSFQSENNRIRRLRLGVFFRIFPSMGSELQTRFFGDRQVNEREV